MSSEVPANPVTGNKPNRVIVEDLQGDDCNSVINLSRSRMETLGLYRGDVVSIRGKKRRETVANVMFSDESSSPSSGDDYIQMNKVVRNNLRVKLGDIVSVTPNPNVEYGRRVHILPIKDSIEGLTGSLFDVFLRPYFHETYRPIHRGDIFMN
ncbi:hypothetical protein ACOME3_006461 [Neoechinorhynchus agilis]